MEWLKMKYDLLVIALRIWLLKLLGVDTLVMQAFEEGYRMAHDDDFRRLRHEVPVSTFVNFWTIHGVADLRKIVTHSRCWRSVDEAWRNSDAQELFDENR